MTDFYFQYNDAFELVQIFHMLRKDGHKDICIVNVEESEKEKFKYKALFNMTAVW